MKSLLVVFSLLLLSCSSENNKLEFSLQQAKGNRIELEKVLNHYKNDSLKYKAATFLIENMNGCFSNRREMIDMCAPFYKQYDSLARIYKYDMNKERGNKIDSLWKNFYSSSNIPYFEQSFSNDLETVSSEYLISEIDLAFKAWQENVHTKNSSFEEFCKYILPYRRKNELLIDDMRKTIYNRHKNTFFTGEGKDMLRESDSLLFLYKHLSHSQFWGTRIPIYDAATFEYLQRGLCAHRCWYNSILFSSLGMAVAIDFVPAWGNRNNSHTWNVLIKDGQSYAFESFWDEDRWKYKIIYNNENFDHLWGKFRLPKVYRHTYENYIEGPFFDKRVKKEDVPPIFKNSKMKDVSEEYFGAKDITITLKTPPKEIAYAYLCVFGYESWHPVQWGKINGNKVTFKKMGKDIIYLPAFYKKGKIIPIDSPFLFNAEGIIEPLDNYNSSINIHINQIRGAMNYDYNRTNIHLISEAVISGRNTINDSLDTLVTLPKSIPMESSNYKVKSMKEYQEVFVNFKTDTTALSEIVFYNDKNMEIDVSEIKSKKLDNEELKLLHDGIYVSGIKKRNVSRQIRISFTQKQKVSRVKVTPFINSDTGNGKTFELYYWQNGRWTFFKTSQAGEKPYLTFKDVPRGKLYMLRNSQSPKEGKVTSERIFICREGEVLWY
ncbi:hypothetical protein [Capnocytophaga cynodegmi]|uniref:Peptide-N(4)-(N-acetyl-beta-glucosaminyl)asparagine amidase n=1 Tax=Capnocytophaga cynodegmi TaxID=28189 RepID=A0A0B7HGT9_9FLAO|nr:hypothetical protein [Capnocytophaga cynodegmi]CEN36743.1 conserved exported hypothetical protein [Capnocytophaga cynodegmi]